MNIIFYTDRTQFTGDALESYGLGGSESAIINLSRELIKLNHNVHVYCNTKEDHISHKVIYHPLETYNSIKPKCDIFISCRSAYALAKEEINAEKILYWCQDDLQEGAVEHLCCNSYIANRIDCLVSVSNYAKNNLLKEVLIPKEKIKVIRNGFNPNFINNTQERIKNRFVYTSTPYRGLDVLLEIWPSIRKQIPNAELFLFTGMSLYSPGSNDNQNFLYNRAKRKEGIILAEPICQRDLLKFLSTCSIMLYPNHYVEASCMAVIESLACGVPVITSNLGALPELIQSGYNGELIDGHSRHPDYQKEFINNIKINNNNIKNAIESVKDYTWSNRAKEWELLFNN